MTRALLLAALLLIPALVDAACTPTPTPLVAKGYEQLTVTTSVATPTIPVGTQMMVVIVGSNSVRMRDDGTNPTSTVGMPYGASTTIPQRFESCGPPLSRVRLIRHSTAGGDAEVNLSYYGPP